MKKSNNKYIYMYAIRLFCVGSLFAIMIDKNILIALLLLILAFLNIYWIKKIIEIDRKDAYMKGRIDELKSNKEYIENYISVHNNIRKKDDEML